MKNKAIKTLVLILSLTLSLTLMVPFPIFAEKNDDGDQTNFDRPYIENEAIVCYVNSDDVNKDALEEEIASSEESENVIESEETVAESTEVSEQLELVDMVDSSKTLMNLGKQPIKRMHGIKKGIIKAKKVREGKARENIGIVKSKKYSTEELVEKLEALPNVEYAEPNYIEKPQAVGDKTNLQWAFNNTSSYGMNIPNWNTSNNVNANDVVVAVIDTGVDYENDDLKDVMWSGGLHSSLTALGGGIHGIDTSATGSAKADPMDEHGHGTHCAGIIGASWNGFGVSGGANGVKIMAVKAGVSDFSTADLVEGMEYIYTAKTKAKVNVVAVNNSWGGETKTSAQSYVDCITKLGQAGVVSVFASGNEKVDCDASYNGEYYNAYFFKGLDSKIVVNSCDSNGNKADSSNCGLTTTDVYAPGVSIYSTVLTSNGSYDYKSGTSMASPAVAAEVAILAANYPEATAQEITKAIIDKNNVTPGNSGLAACVSGGYANVEKALQALETKFGKVDWSFDSNNHWKSLTVDGVHVTRRNEAHDWRELENDSKICAQCGAAMYGSNIVNKGEVTTNEALSTKGLDTVEKIKDALNSQLATKEYVQYMNIDLPSGATLQGDGTIVIPYSWLTALPSSISKNPRYYNFSIAHMIGSGENAGNVETIPFEVTEKGLKLEVTSLSPFAIGVTKKNIDTGDIDGDGKLTSDDITLICQLLTKNTMTGMQKTIIDINQDGVANINDAIDLYNKIAE